MSWLLFLLVLVFVGIGGWGFNRVLLEVAKWRPQEPLNTMDNRLAVEPFIWSPRAPRDLRRLYVIAQTLSLLSGPCLAGFVWLNEPRPMVRFWGTMFFCAFTLLGVCNLVWKLIRNDGM